MLSISKKVALYLLALSWMLAGSAEAQSTSPDVSDLIVPRGPVAASVDARLARTTGEVEIVIRLTDVPLVVAHGKNAKKLGGGLSSAQQSDYLHQLRQKHEALISQIRALGGRELGRVSKAINAVMVAIDASRVNAVAALPNVLTIRPVVNYKLDLSEPVSYIGAAAVQAAGIDGTGVRVAVLDSGIDYTHANFGGPGTAAAYEAAYGTNTSDSRNTTRDGLFPTEKVVEGFDFVGEAWPNGPLAPDPDPIDCGPAAIPAPCTGGHGSHVADIIGGRSLDGGTRLEQQGTG